MAAIPNPDDSFNAVKAGVEAAIRESFPVEGRRRNLVLEKVWTDDDKDPKALNEQLEAKLSDGTWGVRVKGVVSLVDRDTGKVVDRSTVNLANLPKMTNRHSYIVGGNEYQVGHLFRLKSGVYARTRKDGDLVSEFNLAKGDPFSVHLDPATGKFSFQRGRSGNTPKISLYPLLKAVGVGDERLREVWGDAVFKANLPRKNSDAESALSKFFDESAPEWVKKPDTFDGLVQHVKDHFGSMELRPDSTAITLGKPVDKVDGDVLAIASRKILGVSRGTEKEDNRDSLVFKDAVNAEDILADRIRRASKKAVGKIRNVLDSPKRGTVAEVLPGGGGSYFNKPVHEFFAKGLGIAERTEQNNPLQFLSATRKTTILSAEAGGLSSERMITEGMQSIDPSHIGFLDPTKTPEAGAGITVGLGMHVIKEGTDLKIPVWDLKAGKAVHVNPTEFQQGTVILPDQVTWKDGKPVPRSAEVRVRNSAGDIVTAPASSARFVLPSAKAMFDLTTNQIPFLPCDQGNRVSMASKQIEQAISVAAREIPMVQAATDIPGMTFDRYLGTAASHQSSVAGEVVKVGKAAISIKDAAGKLHHVELYDNFPTNDPKGLLHSYPVVAPGDKVTKGQLVADTNFSRNGRLALGLNARVSYLPYAGLNFEDGIVISEDFAKKMSSEHLHTNLLEIDPEKDHVGKKKFLSVSHTRVADMRPGEVDAIGDDGVIKVGTRVRPGQVLVAAVGVNPVPREKHDLTVIRGYKPVKDKSLSWEGDHPGEVVRVVKSPDGKSVKVFVRTLEPMQVGDKVSGRHGNKGVISAVLPVTEMPFTKGADGKRTPLDMLLSPLGTPSRINPGQILETAAAKIAEKTGKPYVVDNFGDPKHDYRAQVEKDLKAHGLSDQEEVFDPQRPDRPLLGKALVGRQYIVKLKHQAEKKVSVRGGDTTTGNKALPFTLDKQPAKGGDHGGQGFGALDFYALLGHQARHNLREFATYKGDEQPPEFWEAIKQGREPPPPQVPFVFKKFEALLNGLGVNVRKEGSLLRLAPLTDKEVVRMSGPQGKLEKPSKMVTAGDMKEEKGGLFDPIATGGMSGGRWSRIELHEPIPNPIFVGSGQALGPIPALLGIKIKDVDAVMAGTLKIDGRTGGEAIKKALSGIDVEAAIRAERRRLPDLHGPALDNANRKLRFLLALRREGLRPDEAYMMKHVPVLPPTFRPIGVRPDGSPIINPLNNLYKNVGILNERLAATDPLLPESVGKAPVRAQLYGVVKALQGMDGTMGYDVESGSRRRLKGILEIIKPPDESPKFGMFQHNMVSKRVGLSFRGVIGPDTSLGLDEIGLPRWMAMESYKPFVEAELVRHGFTPNEAALEIKSNSKAAQEALQRAVKDRPFALKRDPVLHKGSILGGRARLIDGNQIKIHPLVTLPTNADYDGDTMAGTVPVSRAAVEEVRQMFPSKNLFSPTTFGVVYAPIQESVLGLASATKWGKHSGKTFQTAQSAVEAMDRGDLHPTDVVKVGGKETTPGRLLAAAGLPEGSAHREKILHDKSMLFDKKFSFEVSEDLARNHQNHFDKSVNHLKDVGNRFSYDMAKSFGLADFATVPGRDKIMAEADRLASAARKSSRTQQEADEKAIGIYQDATAKMQAAIKAHHAETGNRLSEMVILGAKGKMGQLQQMIASPMLMQDNTGRTVPEPVRKSYSEGLDIADYWIAQHGARKGMIQRAKGTAEPGALSKEILNTTLALSVTAQDCGTGQGILMRLASPDGKIVPDVHGRYTAAPYRAKDGTSYKEGTLVTPDLAARLRNSGVDKVLVRSPLKCERGDGICAKCYGHGEHGRDHPNGTAIGVIAGQSLGEPAVQMAMDSFHSGGIAQGRGAKSVAKIDRLRQILKMYSQSRNDAVLSTADGEVERIEKLPQGGVNVHVAGIPHYVQESKLHPELKVGDRVGKGAHLSHPLDTFANPHHLLKITGDIHEVRNHLTDELDKLYQSEGVRRRNLEVAVRALTGLTRITDPSDSHWTHGEVVPAASVDEHNKALPKGSRKVSHAPILKGVEQTPLSGSDDWLGKLNFQRLHQTITSGAGLGWASDIHGPHPIPGYVYGKEFGLAPPGKPKHHY